MVAINVVDKYTNSDSEQDRVFFGQGFSNCVAGFFGGMAGSGQAHQSLHSLKSGGVSSVSSFMAGVYMLIIMLIGYPVVAKVPLGATAGITLYLVRCCQRIPIVDITDVVPMFSRSFPCST